MSILVRSFQPDDLSQLIPILKRYIRSEDPPFQTYWIDIVDIQYQMLGRLDKKGRERKYLVAVDEYDTIYGCIGYTNADSLVCARFALDPTKTVEGCNFFVSPRNSGIGSELLESVYQYARLEGKDYIIGISGPRYRSTWPIYDQWAERLGEIPNYLTRQIDGEKRTAVIWGRPIPE